MPNSSPAFAGEGDQAKPGGGVLPAPKEPLHRAARGPPPPEIRGRNSLERHQRRGDPAFLAAQQAPDAGGGAAVHHFKADAARVERLAQRARRMGEARTGAQQQEFGRGVEGEERLESGDAELGQRRRVPLGRAERSKKQGPIDSLVDREAPARKAPDDGAPGQRRRGRSGPFHMLSLRLVTRSAPPGPLAVFGRKLSPLTRSHTRIGEEM